MTHSAEGGVLATITTTSTTILPARRSLLNPIVLRRPGSSTLLAPPEALLSWNHGTPRVSDRGLAWRIFLANTLTLHSRQRRGRGALGAGSQKRMPAVSHGSAHTCCRSRASGRRLRQPGPPSRIRRTGALACT